MDKLNELESRAKRLLAPTTGEASETMLVEVESVLAAVEAFREMHQRAEAAEAKLAELAKQEPVAWLNTREGDRTYPCVFVTKEEAQRNLERVTLWPWVKTEPLFTRPAPAAVPVDLVPDYFDRLVVAARARAEKAMRKFPQPNYVLNKVAEESGEVIKAVIHYTEGREDWLSVEGELIDNLAMLIRLVTEGDGVIGFSPPEDVLRRIEELK